ncbi:MAG: hypothetical protein E7643_02385 [Ruminococcaceae bacterium]|nr:hypothetical protein [Oscillospiraceae bacterium]
MLKKENNYDFREELRQVHKKDRRDYSETCGADELELKNGICIVLPTWEDAVIYTAAKDFADYLFVSMGIGAMIATVCPSDVQKIQLSLSQDIGEASGYSGYSITTEDDCIFVEGYDSRGVMQGLFFIEDLMNLRKGPFMKKGNIRRRALFDFRMVQSPLGMFDYTDEALSLMAHFGYDSLDVWLKDGWTTLRGDYIDMRSLANRAEKYGIKINIELYKVHAMHPEEVGAQEYYDQMYGNLFRACPKIGSIILEGEANHFVSRDPAACIESTVDDIPTGKPKTGWWPCKDYPQFAQMIINAVRKHSKDTQILFSTYNWGFAPEEDRIRLIEHLPDDLTVLATWDMFHQFRNENSVSNIPDYSLRFIGPGEYFQSEAVACKKRGMKIASISNTGGKTWDFGVIPYEPAPGRWIERLRRIIHARKEWGVSGLQECIHYGFYPSIVCELSKWAAFTEIKPLEQVYEDLLRRDFGEHSKKVREAFDCFDEAIASYPISDADQYGGFRIGPAYPVWLLGAGKKPAMEHAVSKDIYYVPYHPYGRERTSLPGIRLIEELAELQTMDALFEKGISILENTGSDEEKLLKLTNMIKFMKNTCVTVKHTKEVYLLVQRLRFESDRRVLDDIIDQLERILLAEKENVENTIPIVQCDSVLGWEPGMEYTGDEAALRWKLRQLDYEINHTIGELRVANGLIDTIQNKD